MGGFLRNLTADAILVVGLALCVALAVPLVILEVVFRSFALQQIVEWLVVILIALHMRRRLRENKSR